jgi:hypothetical protein
MLGTSGTPRRAPDITRWALALTVEGGALVPRFTVTPLGPLTLLDVVRFGARGFVKVLGIFDAMVVRSGCIGFEDVEEDIIAGILRLGPPGSLLAAVVSSFSSLSSSPETLRLRVTGTKEVDGGGEELRSWSRGRGRRDAMADEMAAALLRLLLNASCDGEQRKSDHMEYDVTSMTLTLGLRDVP